MDRVDQSPINSLHASMMNIGSRGIFNRGREVNDLVPWEAPVPVKQYKLNLENEQLVEEAHVRVERQEEWPQPDTTHKKSKQVPPKNTRSSSSLIIPVNLKDEFSKIKSEVKQVNEVHPKDEEQDFSGRPSICLRSASLRHIQKR